MRRYLDIAILVLSSVMLSCNAVPNGIAVIPEPVQIKEYSLRRGFVFDCNVVIRPVSEMEVASAELLAEDLWRITDVKPPVTDAKSAKEVILMIDSTINLPKDGYRIDVLSKRIKLVAKDPAGLFYATRTLLQLVAEDSPNSIPACSIEDYPRMPWRGVMIDCSQHFFTKEELKQLLSIAALHKINTFHWHLTDKDCWRLEMECYPLLTSAAFSRADSMGQPWRRRLLWQPCEECCYDGYYTRDDVREIVAYAAARHIKVVPEIEMQGHCIDVFAANHEYSCRKSRTDIPVENVKAEDDVFCTTESDAVFEFLENIIDEVAELFPSEYIHFGGDAAYETYWRNWPACRQRIDREELSNEDELQTYFVNRMARYISSIGKTPIGWGEVLRKGLDNNVVVMAGHGYQSGMDAAQSGHRVIMTPSTHTYLNFYQANPDFEPAIARSAYLTSIKTAYCFDPVPDGLTVDQSRNVIGGQASTWCEYIPTYDYLEYMLLPRLGATADALWAQPNVRDWDRFVAKQPRIGRLYDRFGYNHSESSFRVDVDLKYTKSGIKVTLSSSQVSPDIRYTFGDSVSADMWKRYKRPFMVKTESTLSTAIFANGIMKEEPTVQRIVPQNMAVGKNVEYITPVVNKFGNVSAAALVDGRYGDRFRVDNNWQEFDGGMNVIVDLERVVDTECVVLGFLYAPLLRIVVPEQITVCGSVDGQTYMLLGVTDNINRPEADTAYVPVEIACNRSLPVRYVKVIAQNQNNNDLIMVDEIIIK